MNLNLRLKRLLTLTCCIFSGMIATAQSAKKIHKDAIVIDTHNDVITNQLTSGRNLSTNDGEQFDLVKARKGGLDAQIFSIWGDEDADYAHANREINFLDSMIRVNPKKIMLVRNASELINAVKSKKMAALVGVEGGHMINNRLDYIDSLYKRGMCYMTLTWNNSNPWATSAADETLRGDSLKHKGLTDFGKQVIERMNKLGVMVDVSHVGERTFYDVLAASTKPIIASHSSVYNICPHRRNLKDEQLKAIAAKDGVVFVNFYSEFVDSTYRRKLNSFMRTHKKESDSLRKTLGSRSKAEDVIYSKYKDELEALRPPLSLLVDHIDYIAKLVGPSHVGLGADFEGAHSFPQQLDDVSDYPLITEELLKRGYSEKDIKLVLGENLIRVLKANTGK